MISTVNSYHPRSTFRFYVIGNDLSDDALCRMQSLITGLGESRTWVLGPPTLSEERDGDIRFIGGTLDLYTAVPPFGADLPKEVDRQHLEEVIAIVEALAAFSQETRVEVNFTLDQSYVGRIKNGVPDRLIQVGLLGEWKKVHGMS